MQNTEAKFASGLEDRSVNRGGIFPALLKTGLALAVYESGILASKGSKAKRRVRRHGQTDEGEQIPMTRVGKSRGKRQRVVDMGEVARREAEKIGVSKGGDGELSILATEGKTYASRWTSGTRRRTGRR